MKKLLTLLIALAGFTGAHAACSAGFTAASTPTPSAPLRWTFTNNTTATGYPPNVLIFKTIFYGDNQQGAFYNPTTTHDYALPGTYTVKVKVTVVDSTNMNAILCADSTTQTITVAYTACASSFTTALNGNVATFSINNLSNAPNPSYFWNYGDASTGTSNTHAYATPGTYNVCLMTVVGTCTSTVCNNVIITTGPPANVISGVVIWDSIANTPAQSMKVWLVQYSATTQILSAVDSQVVSGNYYANYSFTGKPAGSYRVKAARQNNTAIANGIIPTYHNTSLYWGTATVINHTGGSSVYKNVYTAQGAVTAGPGFIAGNVTLGANKGTGAGVPNVDVILRDNTGMAIQFATTDALGAYAFSNLPAGTYTVYPELMNFQTTPWTVVITAAAPNQTDGGFLVSMNNKTVVPGIETGVSNVNRTDDFVQVSPNPSNGVLHLNWKSGPGIKMTISILDLTGRVLSTSAISAGSATSSTLQLQHLPKGMYTLRVQAGDKLQNTAVLLQ